MAPGAGLGGSAAHALINGRDPVQSELDLGVGWQDPAVIRETGLCVWRSGPKPVLDFKVCASLALLAGMYRHRKCIQPIHPSSKVVYGYRVCYGAGRALDIHGCWALKVGLLAVV